MLRGRRKHRFLNDAIYAALLMMLKVICILVLVLFLAWQFTENKISKASFGEVSAAVLTDPPEETLPADAAMFRRLYHLRMNDFADCALYYPSTNMGAEELLVIRLADETQAEAVRAALEARKSTLLKSFEGYGAAQTELLNESIIDVRGGYAVFLSAKDARQRYQRFLNTL